jgi:phosphopantetheinyl transferase (holo-ACP synthase)
LIAVKEISLEGSETREVEAVQHEVRLLRQLRHESIASRWAIPEAVSDRC